MPLMSSPDENESPSLAQRSSGAIGRRDLLKAAAALGAGAAVPSWLASPDAARAAATVRYGPRHRILQPGMGPRPGTYIRATLETIRWGRLPNRLSEPIATVRSGAVVTFDTVSHEGILEDQGRNPVAYFASKGVPARDVLLDAQAIADSDLAHDFAKDGPHIVVGPVAVAGAERGDVLRVDVLRLLPRVPYAVISNRHGTGALPGVYPEGPPPSPIASPQRPELYHNVSIFTPLRRRRGKEVLVLPVNRRRRAEFALKPFLGTMGVALDTDKSPNSVPPSVAGGNLDINDLQVGSTLYLPVMVPGAKFYVGDPHFAQGDGEVALTAAEGSLRATLRLTLIKHGSDRIPGRRPELTGPFVETSTHWIPVGLDKDLDEAMRKAVREGIEFLHGEFGMPRRLALAYLSAATNFAVGEVVDEVKQIHGHIVKEHFVRAPGEHPRR
jgi:acetamidase/formamidase